MAPYGVSAFLSNGGLGLRSFIQDLVPGAVLGNFVDGVDTTASFKAPVLFHDYSDLGIAGIGFGCDILKRRALLLLQSGVGR